MAPRPRNFTMIAFGGKTHEDYHHKLKLSLLWWVGTAPEGSKARMPILRRGARTEMGFTDGTYRPFTYGTFALFTRRRTSVSRAV